MWPSATWRRTSRESRSITRPWVSSSTNCATGSITGTVTNNGTLAGDGTITGTLRNFGILSPGNSIGTKTVIGDYVADPSSTLTIEVSPTNGESDRLLVITGTAQLAGTLSIIPLGNIPSSNQYTIIDADGGISGSFDQILNASAFSFDLDFTSNPNELLLSVVGVDFAGVMLHHARRRR